MPTTPTDSIDQIVETLSAAASPIRLKMLARLSERAYRPSELADHLLISANLCHRHLAVLRDSGLVTSRTDPDAPRSSYYEIADPEAINRLRRFAPEIFPALPPLDLSS